MPRADDDEGPHQDRPMTLAEHLDELRKRLVVAVAIAAAFCIACAFFEEQLLAVALAPVNAVLLGVKGGDIIATEPGEMFFAGMKIDIVFGIFFASPAILYLIWGFVARGLYDREKRYVRLFAPISYLLFAGGCAFFYFVIQPLTLGFLLTYHTRIMSFTGDVVDIAPKLRISATVSFFLTMTLVTGLMFEMPLVMIFLQAIRVCTWRTYVKYARHFVFGLIVFSAIVTPTGDMFTLAVFMVPILVLFASGIVICRIMAPKDV